MEKNPSQSNSHVRTRYKPYIKWHKETDEWECRAIEETYIEQIPEEETMGKVKESEPAVEYEPSYIPIERELLYAMSNLIVALKHKDEPIADLPQCIEAVDAWLTERYNDLEDHVLESGNGHAQKCEETY